MAERRRRNLLNLIPNEGCTRNFGSFVPKECIKPYISCARDQCNETEMMEGFGNPSNEDQHRWARLTEKQRACLDLLLERQTSKGIARRLDISKDTVDQRITAARKILGAADRDQAAIVYGRLKQIYDRVVYDPVELPSPSRLMPSDFADGDPSSAIEVRNRQDAWDGSSGKRLSFGKIWRRDHESASRLTIITAFLLAAVLIALGGLNIAETLSRLVSD
jgi:DNA-binding CsgD family transcriptional regulator